MASNLKNIILGALCDEGKGAVSRQGRPVSLTRDEPDTVMAETVTSTSTAYTHRAHHLERVQLVWRVVVEAVQ
jgi:hypothetical protein